MTEVVAALIWQDDRFLICRRPIRKARGGLWEFVGGKVEKGETPEQAYWYTEMLDAYCHMLILAKQIGHVGYFTKSEEEELLALKKKWGIDDPRFEMKDCDICSNDVFRDSWKEAGLAHRGFNPPSFKDEKKDDSEALIAEITKRVMDALKK